MAKSSKSGVKMIYHTPITVQRDSTKLHRTPYKKSKCVSGYAYA